jgi:hypothetical protein
MPLLEEVIVFSYFFWGGFKKGKMLVLFSSEGTDLKVVSKGTEGLGLNPEQRSLEIGSATESAEAPSGDEN